MRTVAFIIRRLLLMIPIVFGVLAITFIIGRIIPADPIHLFVGQEDDQAVIERVREELGLNEPIWVQFYRYISNFIRGDLGMCWSTRNPVVEDLALRLPATFELILLGLVFCIVLALPLGIFAAVRRDSLVDHVARVTSLLGVAIPSFWLGLLLIYFFFYKLGWSPPPIGRIGFRTSFPVVTGFYLIDSLLAGDIKAFGEVLGYLVLPVAALSLRKLAQLSRLVRSTMIEVLASDYILTARSQGLKKRLINYRLALKNGLLPPITQIGQMFGDLIGGAVVIELVFAWPGAGRWAVTSALAGDFAPIQAFAVICAIARIVVFLIADILYVVIDPRIRY
jgi:peptide/nickel transport system permease protein